jgi:hypothetical protein
VPESANIVHLCKACLESNARPFYEIPDSLCARFGLARLDEESMEAALSHIPADAEDEER